MITILAGIDSVTAGWGLSQLVPDEVSPDKLKILKVKIFEKSKCKAGPLIERSKEYICATVPGVQNQSTCMVTLYYIEVYKLYYSTVGQGRRPLKSFI